MNLKTLGDIVRLGYLMAFPGSKATARVHIEDITLGNLRYRRFWAGDKQTPLVILHGLTRKGYDDLRLNHFCRVMALLGFEVFAPNLNSLENLDFSVQDVECIVQILQVASSDKGAKVGLLGFSFGAGYGLLAASDPRISGQVSFVLAVDGYSSLDRVIDFTFSEACSDPYGRLCLAWVCRKDLGLTQKELNEYEALMGDYCTREMNFTRKDRQIMTSLLEPKRQVVVEAHWRKAIQKLHELDVENNLKLAEIQADVYLMHNANDTLMPVEETSGVYRTLKACDHRVWISISRAPGHLNYLKGDLVGPVNIFYRLLCMR